MNKTPNSDQKIALVSSADKNYFPLLVEWVASLKNLPSLSEHDTCIFDAGLEPEQCTKLEQMGCKVIAPDWPCKIPDWKLRGRNYLKSCVCRPFIPKIFPGYDVYIWLDCDTWLQTEEAIDLLIRGANKDALAIIPQVDRNMQRMLRLEWLGPFVKKARSFYYSNARRAFSGKVARNLCARPILNAGVFALRVDAPHWQAWQDLIVKAMKRGRIFTAEQLSLGVLTYQQGYKVEPLPFWCNWLCEIVPHWDKERRMFVEPSLPNHPISVMHLSGFDEMRRNRKITQEVSTTAGDTINITLRYPHLNGEKP